MVLRVAVAERRRHHHAGLRRRLLRGADRHGLAEQRIGADGQVRAVLLDGGGGEQRNRPRGDAPDLLAGHLGQ